MPGAPFGYRFLRCGDTPIRLLDIAVYLKKYALARNAHPYLIISIRLWYNSSAVVIIRADASNAR